MLALAVRLCGSCCISFSVMDADVPTHATLLGFYLAGHSRAHDHALHLFELFSSPAPLELCPPATGRPQFPLTLVSPLLCLVPPFLLTVKVGEVGAET